MENETKTNNSIWPVLILIAVLVAGYFFFTAKKPEEKPANAKKDKIRLQLKWVPQSQFAGYFAAKKQGYYDKENIDVEIKPGGVGINPVDVLIAGDVDVAIAWTANVLPAVSKGEDIVEIGQGLQRTGMTLVAKKASGVLKPADIKGKKIGYWLGGNEIEPYAFIGKQGFDREKDVTMVSQGFDMNQLLNDEIDVASAMRYNELELVYEAGNKPEDLTVFDFDKEGVGMLQDALFVKREYLEKNKDLLVRFLRASMKGWDWAVMNQEKAVDSIGMDFTENAVTAKAHQIKSMKVMAGLFTADEGTTKGLFYISKPKLENTVAIVEKYVPEVKNIDVNKIYTEEIWNEAVKGVTFSKYPKN